MSRTLEPPTLVVAGRLLHLPCEHCKELFDTYVPNALFCKKKPCQAAKLERNERLRKLAAARRKARAWK